MSDDEATDDEDLSEEHSEDFSETLKRFETEWAALEPETKKSVLSAFSNLLPDHNPLDIKAYDVQACQAFKEVFERKATDELCNCWNDAVSTMVSAESQQLMQLLRHGQFGRDLRAHIDQSFINGPSLSYGRHPDTVRESAGFEIKFSKAKEPSEPMEKHLSEAVHLAREMVADTLKKIQEWRIDGQVPDAFKSILDFHMKADLASAPDQTRAKLKVLKEKFEAISTGLNQESLRIADMDGRFKGSNAPGWVPAYPEMRGKHVMNEIDESLVSKSHTIHNRPEGSLVTGNIHISYESLKPDSQNYSNNAQLANIIIHEASHKFLHTEDVSYANGNGGKSYGALDWQESLNNADSYSMTATCVHHGSLIECHAEIQAIGPHGGHDVGHKASPAAQGKI